MSAKNPGAFAELEQANTALKAQVEALEAFVDFMFLSLADLTADFETEPSRETSLFIGAMKPHISSSVRERMLRLINYGRPLNG